MKNSSHKNNFESNENIYGIGKNFLESKIKKYKKDIKFELEKLIKIFSRRKV